MAHLGRKLVLIVALTQLAVASEVFDVTTVYRLKGGAGAQRHIGGEVISRTNARGLPLRRGKIVINGASGGASGKCCIDWERDGWRKLLSNEATEVTPILDPTILEATPGPALQKAGDGSWRGAFRRGESIRIDYTPESRGRGYLSFVLCDTPRSDHCVGAVVSGHNDGRLRFIWSRYGADEETGPFWVPGAGDGILKSTVISKDDSVKEIWEPARTYGLLLEYTDNSNLILHLEGGQQEYEKDRTFSIPPNYEYISIGVFRDGQLGVQADPAYKGIVDSDSNVQVNFMPSSKGDNLLGVAICKQQQQENCFALLISGSNGNKLRYNWNKYTDVESNGQSWLPGQINNKKIVNIAKDQSVKEAWDHRAYNITVKKSGGQFEVALTGGDPQQAEKLKWNVPAPYNFIVVAVYRNKGAVRVQGSASLASQSTRSAQWPVWTLDYGRSEGVMVSPPIPKPASSQLCVLLGAKVPAEASVKLGFRGVGLTTTQPITDITPGEESLGWKQVRAEVEIPLSLRSQRLQLVLSATVNTEESIYIQYVDTCVPEREEDLSVLFDDHTPTKDLFGFDVASATAATKVEGESGPCKHGGILDTTAKTCRCPPGFRGGTCDIGCGNNQLGADCKAQCSEDTQKGCKGMLLCGPGLPCECATGWRGSTCEQACPPTKYGPGCKLRCGRCFHGDTCDRFTGRCPRGCTAGFQPPLCLDTCGTKFAPSLIVHGSNISIEDVPWHVALYRSEKNRKKPEFICGGSLIRPTQVLTAAHCLWDKSNHVMIPAERFKVAMGKVQSDWDAKEEKEVFKRNVWYIAMAPEYRGALTSHANDIAILVLDQAVPYGPTITPICLFYTPEFEFPLDAKTGRVVGWGETTQGSGQSAKELLLANLPYIPKDACYRAIPNNYYNYINGPDKFCAGVIKPDGQTTTVAKGDSGGGLSFRDQRGTWFIRGIVSVGVGDFSVAFYTDVSHFRDFITKVRDQAEIRDSLLSSGIL